MPLLLVDPRWSAECLKGGALWLWLKGYLGFGSVGIFWGGSLQFVISLHIGLPNPATPSSSSLAPRVLWNPHFRP